MNDMAYSFSCKIRKEFFSLFTKFLMFTLPFNKSQLTNLNYEDDAKKPKNGIIINFEADFEKDPVLKEFFSDFVGSLSSNIIYKHKCKATDTNITNLIMIDELLKVLVNDPTRLYFDQCLGIVEKLPQNEKMHIVEIQDNDFFYSIGGLHNSIHVYNLIKLRHNLDKLKNVKNQNLDINSISINTNYPGYFLDETATDKYFINYQHLYFFFEKFNNFLARDNKLMNIISIESLAIESYEDSLNKIIFSEIQAFVHLIKTATLYIGDLKQIVTANLILLMIIQILSTDVLEEKEMKLVNVLDIFFKSNGLDNHFNFITSLIYKIICSDDDIREQYEYYFLFSLQELSTVPTFFIYLAANDENKEKQFKRDTNPNLLNRKLSLSNKNSGMRNSSSLSFSEIEIIVPVREYIKCINGCILEMKGKLKVDSLIIGQKVNSNDNISKLSGIVCSNMDFVKCSICQEENFLILSSCYDNYEKEFEIVLKHPMVILLKFIEEIVLNKSFVYSKKQMANLLDPIIKDEIRILLFFSNYFNILNDNNIIYSNL